MLERIKAEGLVKTFDQVRALDGAALHVPQGAVYGLVGPNGAGKSTIIRCLTGAYRPDSGQVLLDEVPVYENPSAKQRICCIPDDPYYLPQASTRDMAKVYAGLYPGFDWDRYGRLAEAFSQVSDRTGLRKLSRGMQKQAAFWVALCCHPEVLLLDEPVDGLDPVMRRQVWSLLLEDVAQNGLTVLVSSHNLRELEDVCDHVGVMHKGRILLEKSLQDLQGSVTKLQIVWPDGVEPALPEGLELLHRGRMGRVHTLILRGGPEAVLARFADTNPVFSEALPLSLEEVFIYEMGGEDYGVQEILL